MEANLCPVKLHGFNWLFLIPALFALLLLILASTGHSKGSSPISFHKITVRLPSLALEVVMAFILAVVAFLLFQIQFDPTWERWVTQLPFVKDVPFAEFEPGESLNNEAGVPLSELVDRVQEAKNIKISISRGAASVVVKGTYNGDCWADLMNDICDRNGSQLSCKLVMPTKTLYVCRAGGKDESCPTPG